MNLKAIYEEVTRLVPRGHICVQLEVVRYSVEEGPVIRLSLYDSNLSKWYGESGSGKGDALELFRAEHPPLVPTAPAPAILDTVADVQMPEAPAHDPL